MILPAYPHIGWFRGAKSTRGAVSAPMPSQVSGKVTFSLSGPAPPLETATRFGPRCVLDGQFLAPYLIPGYIVGRGTDRATSRRWSWIQLHGGPPLRLSVCAKGIG